MVSEDTMVLSKKLVNQTRKPTNLGHHLRVEAEPKGVLIEALGADAHRVELQLLLLQVDARFLVKRAKLTHLKKVNKPPLTETFFRSTSSVIESEVWPQ